MNGRVTDAKIGRCAVGRRYSYWVAPAGQHPVLGPLEGRFRVWNIVAVAAYEPVKAPPLTGISRSARHRRTRRHRVGGFITCLALGPIDGLEHHDESRARRRRRTVTERDVLRARHTPPKESVSAGKRIVYRSWYP